MVGAEETGVTGAVSGSAARDAAAGTRIRVRVLAFARLRELLGFSERELDAAADGATVTAERVWTLLAERCPAAELAALRASTRFARNGVLIDPSAPLADGDEVALLPPVGGG